MDINEEPKLDAAAGRVKQEAALIVDIDWALLNRGRSRAAPYGSISIPGSNPMAAYTKRPKRHYDIMKSLQGIAADLAPVTIKTGDEPEKFFLATSFVFKQEEGKR